MLTPTTVAAFWDEMEKIAGVGLPAGITAGVLGAAAGLGGTALYLHGNAQQDRYLRDVGLLDPEEAGLRQMKRVAAMVGVGTALGIGGAALGGMGAPMMQRYVAEAIEQSTKGMWETAGKNLQAALDQGLERQVKSGDKLLKKQMEYGTDLIRNSAPDVAGEVGSQFVRGALGNVPLLGRFFRPAKKVLGG